MLNAKWKKSFFLGLFIAVTIAFCDLFTKKLIFVILDNKALELGISHPEIVVFNFFSLVKVWNRGVSFGMFNQLDAAPFLLSLLQFAIMIIVLFWLYRNEKPHFTWALGLIAGGALGNLTDRIKNGAVADFLDFHIASYHWPAFNLADSSVFIGVMILLLDDLIFTKK